MCRLCLPHHPATSHAQDPPTNTPTPSASTNKTLLLAHPGGPSIYATLLQSNPHSPAREQCIREEGAAGTEVWLAIGPEGGWSADEVEVMSQRGFVLVGLGHRPLRTDVRGRFAMYRFRKDDIQRNRERNVLVQHVWKLCTRMDTVYYCCLDIISRCVRHCCERKEPFRYIERENDISCWLCGRTCGH